MTKISLQEISYYLFFSFLFFAKGIGLYDGQPVFKIFLVAALACFLLKMILTEYNDYELIYILLTLGLALVIYGNTREKGILFVACILTGLKNIPIKRLFRVALFVWCISFLPMVLLTAAGILESPFKVHVRPVIGFVIRWGLGYVHPNVTHISFLIFCALVVYALDKKLSWKLLLLLFIGNCFIFGYTVSFTGFLMTSFYLFLNLYLLIRKNPGRTEYALVQCVLPLCILMSLVLPLVLTGEAFDIVNKLMNTRLNLARKFLTEERITLFGSGMQLTTSMVTMDNSFVFAFMTYGVAAFTLISIGYFILIRDYVKKHADRELAILVVFLAAGISEPFLFNTSFKNLTLIFLGAMIFDRCRSVHEQRGGKTLKLLSGWNRQFSISTMGEAWIAYGEDVASRFAKIIRVAVATGAVAGLILYLGLWKQPEHIIVPKQVCDSIDTKPLYLTEEDVRENKTDLILGYIDEKTEMIPFTGNTIWVEQVRGSCSSILFGGVIGGIVVFTAGCVIQYSDLNKRRK